MATGTGAQTVDVVTPAAGESVTEAVLWHGGEAKPMRDSFAALSATARAQLLAYVAYPFADPVPLRTCVPAAATP